MRTTNVENKIETAASAPGERAQSRQHLACYALFLVAVVVVAAVRFHVRNMPLERDEGEYAYVGQMMLHGIPPYKLASNMKLPGTYAAYAAIMAVFGQTAGGIHVGMILVTSLAAVLVFFLGRYLYGPRAASVAGTSYVFLAARPGVLGIDGHATHFVVVTALAGILLLLYAIDRKSVGLIFASGLSFGLSFLMKQPGILFAIFAGLYWIYCESKRRVPARKLAIGGTVFLAGTALPYILTSLFLLWSGVFGNFWFWTWTYVREYGSALSWSERWEQLGITLPWAVRPFVLWELVAIGLAAPLWSRCGRTHAGFVAGFFSSSCVAVCIGWHFRPHYFIMLLPAAALCIGVAVECAQEELNRRNFGRLASLPLLYFVAALLTAVFGQWKTFSHLDPVALSRKIHEGQTYADAVTVANFISAHALSGDQIGILGSEPEICFYTRLRCASSFLYMYPLIERQRFAKQMQEDVMRELREAHPRFLVYVDNERSWGWKNTLSEYRPFLERAWNFAHSNYALAYQVPLPDVRGYPEHLWGDDACLYVFERKPK